MPCPEAIQQHLMFGKVSSQMPCGEIQQHIKSLPSPVTLLSSLLLCPTYKWLQYILWFDLSNDKMMKWRSQVCNSQCCAAWFCILSKWCKGSASASGNSQKLMSGLVFENWDSRRCLEVQLLLNLAHLSHFPAQKYDKIIWDFLFTPILQLYKIQCLTNAAQLKSKGDWCSLMLQFPGKFNSSPKIIFPF